MVSATKPNLTPGFSPLRFDKYVFRKGETIPAELDIRGAIAITRDTKHKGWLHVLFYIFQLIQRLFFPKRCRDANMCHGMIILERDTKHTKKLIIAHSVFGGVKTASVNYLSPDTKDVTELVVYIPKEKNLREKLVWNAHRSAYTRPQFRSPSAGDRDIVKNPFSVADMFGALFSRQSDNPSKQSMRRTALLVADMLLDGQIKNRKEKPRALFCVPYGLMALQGTMLIESLHPADVQILTQETDGKLRTRMKIADVVFERLKQNATNDPLAQCFWNNPIAKIDGRFATASRTATVLDLHSDLKKGL